MKNEELRAENEQLKQQLAEYEAIKNKYKTIFLDRFVDAKVEDSRIWKEEYDKLKQQLAEKEREIDKLKRVAYVDLSMREIVELKIPPKDQDKISFAVEQLEKVKEEVKYYGYEFSKSMHEYIDNQIKQVKEG